MNIRKALILCCSLPLLGSAMRILVQLFSSVVMTESGDKVSKTAYSEEDDLAAEDNNRAAQIQLRQVQRIRIA